jgi:hypothetical protein
VADPADKNEIEQFLNRQKPYVRSYLRDGSITKELGSALTRKRSFQAFFKALDEYLEVLKRHPEELRKYRQREAKLALSRLPAMRRGRPRKDALASEAVLLRQQHWSYRKISDELNRKYGAGTTDPDSIGNLIRSRTTKAARGKS